MKTLTAFLKEHRFKPIIANYAFWLIAIAFVVTTLFHYSTPQVRPLSDDVSLSRHAVERILFILPVAGATFAFGQLGGWITFILSILVMLPRTIWLSPYRTDALIETAATALVGYLVIWIINTEEKEKKLRQKAVARMRAFNAMCSIVATSLELEQVLNQALDKALEVTGLTAGLIFFLEPQTQELVLAAHRGVTEKTVAGVDRLCLGEGFCGRVAQLGELMVVEDTAHDTRLTRMVIREEGLRSQVIAPLTSKGKIQGVIALGSRELRKFPSADLQLISTFGKQIGVGVENAQLHRNVEQQLRVQQHLNEVAEKITSELELDRVLPKVLQIAEDLVGADCGFIALFDPGSKNIGYPYLHNLPQELTNVIAPQGEGVAGEVISTVQPTVIRDYQVYPKAIPDFAATGLAEVVAVPIVSGRWSFGALAVGSLDREKHFSMQDAATLLGVGRQAGIAIDNARLYENMRYNARQITQAQEDERKRIAREAHDETAQILVALSRRLDTLITSHDEPLKSTNERLEQLRELTMDALKSVRRFSQDLRPPVLDDLGFLAAVQGMARTLEEEIDLRVQLEVVGAQRRLAPEKELVLFRIAQEALNNIRRHAGASQAKIEVAFYPTHVHMSIQDDGCGFNAPERYVDLMASGKLGLIGMHERAQILDGALRIASQPGQGTTVSVDVPVQTTSRTD